MQLHSANSVLHLAQTSHSQSTAVRQQQLTQQLKCKIGGVVGLGSSEATANISLTKNIFAANEEILVNINIDNSKCKKPVKNISAHLMRTVECLSQGQQLWKKEHELGQQEIPGCAEKVVEQKVLRFRVPNYEQNLGAQQILQPGFS